ncbi:MAG: adenylosuccinate lyase [Candidatus Omnitrophica bacterium]|nr:adenylosuccinate lyase [Candidatus Omnitrophota bacterium]
MIKRYSRPEMARIWTDQNRFEKMLEVEILACEAFAELGQIPEQAVKTIAENAEVDAERVKEIEKVTNHDVVAFIKNVSESVGEDAKYFHFGLTSSDVLDTGLSMMMVQAADILIKDAEEVAEALKKRAIEHKHTPMMGRSHGVHAEPVSFGLKMALYYREMSRNIERLRNARRTIAVGKISGSVGTFANVDPYVEEYVCRKLELEPAGVSSQIIQRDRHAEYLNAIALTGATLEKIALEVRGLQKTEIGEVQEYFASGQTGSSSMPHKKNPIISERLCGLARLLRTNALAAVENVALWHERDISHSSVERVIIPDSTILLDYMLVKARDLVARLVVNPDTMLRNVEVSRGLVYSQHVMLEMIKKGATRMEAYEIVQRAALKAHNGEALFKDLLLEDEDMSRFMTREHIEECFSLDYHLRHIDTIFNKIGIA